MRTVEVFRWYLPNPNPRGKPYLSRWAMTAAEAAERGAIEPALHTREVRQVPETDEELRALAAQQPQRRPRRGARRPVLTAAGAVPMMAPGHPSVARVPKSTSAGPSGPAFFTMLKPGQYDYLDPIGAPAQRIEVREVEGELVARFEDPDEGPVDLLVEDLSGELRPAAG